MCQGVDEVYKKVEYNHMWHYSTYVHRVGTHMTHTELQRLHCRRVLVGCAVGECVAQSDRYIHSIQVYTPLLLPQGNGTGGKGMQS